MQKRVIFSCLHFTSFCFWTQPLFRFTIFIYGAAFLFGKILDWFPDGRARSVFFRALPDFPFVQPKVVDDDFVFCETAREGQDKMLSKSGWIVSGFCPNCVHFWPDSVPMWPDQREAISHVFEMFPWKQCENQRRFRCRCATGSACSGARPPPRARARLEST